MPLDRTPSPQQLFGQARAEILGQHEALRRQLWDAIATAEAAVAGDTVAADRVPTLLITLVGQLKAHMSFEESVLLPLLEAHGPRSAAEAAALVSEHARQRAELARLVERPRPTHTLGADTLALQLLVEALLVDMTYEERKLLRSGI